MIDKPHLLIFTDWYVPGYKAGGPIQSVYQLAQLLNSQFHIKIVTRNTDYNSSTPYENIESNVWTTVQEGVEVLYLSKEQITYKKIKEIVKVNKSNRLLINGLFSIYFSFLPAFFAMLFGVSKSYVAVRGMLHASALSVKPIKKQLFLAFVRGLGLYKSKTMLASSEEEVSLIKRVLGPQTNVRLLPNLPITPSAFTPKVFKKNEDTLRLLFLGRISPEKNPITLVKALQSVSFTVNVTFCGAFNEKQYADLFEKECKLLPNCVQMTHVQHCPHHEIEALFLNHDILVLPSLGENFGHAIFESFAYSTPVIIGNNTPWKGIKSEKAGVEIEPTNSQSLLEELQFFNQLSQAEYTEWQQGAYKKATQYFEINNFKETYTQVFS
jgi:glycosyltransferase involved in cell wall biosynthesis